MVHLDAANRRASDRFRLHAPYTRVAVTPLPHGCGAMAELHPGPAFEGHAYNLSMTGLRFELDEPIAPGITVEVRLYLPGESCPIRACGQVVRIFAADDDPGPRRMAVHFETFASDAARIDLARLIEERRFGRPE